MPDERKTEAELPQEPGLLRRRVAGLERKVADRELAEQEAARLAKLPGEDPNPILRISNDCTILYANDASSVVLQTWQRQVGQRLPEPCCQRAEESLRSGKVSTFEFTCVDGRVFLVTLAPVVQEGYLNAYGVDITERKQKENELRQYQFMIESAHDAIFFKDLESRYIIANSKTLEAFGLSGEQVIGKNDFEIMADKEQAKTNIEDDNLVFRTGKATEITKRMTDARGKQRWFHGIKVPQCDDKGNIIGLIGVARDITESKQIEDDLRESRTILRRIIDILPVRVFWKNKDSKYLGCNETFVKDAGLKSADEIVGKSDFELVWKNQAELYRAGDKEVMETGRPKLTYEEPSTTPSGDTIWLNTSKVPLKNAQGEITGVLGVYSDITGQKQMQEALVTRDKAMASSINAIAISDHRGVLTYVNQAFLKILRYEDAKEVLGKSIFELAYNKDVAKKVMQEVLTAGSWVGEFATARRDGSPLEVHVSASAVRGEDGKIICLTGSFVDITDFRRQERELNLYREKTAQAERLASLGTLSATIAHELTQPLTAIGLSIENSLAELEAGSCPAGVMESLRDGLEEVSHAASIIDRLRHFARQSSEKAVTEVDLAEVARKIVRLFDRRAQQADISLQLKGLKKLPPIYVHTKDMEQLFFALIDNAIRAADGKKKRRLTVSGAVKGQYIELQFADDCGGIAPENLDKIFQPFFTTWPASEGIGLGLCIVEHIASRAGGKVWVENIPGKGATFFVTLPI